MPAQYQTAIETPVGKLVLSQLNEAIIRVGWGSGSSNDHTALFDEASRQVNAYFDGKLKQFDLPLHYRCSEFQKLACEEMDRIQYGETKTYGELAKIMGSSAQAIGNACGGNPFPIIIPCHRVLGGKDIGGFSGQGGIETKLELLKHEAAIPWLI